MPCDAMSDFYRTQAASFSVTCASPWHGLRCCVAMRRRLCAFRARMALRMRMACACDFHIRPGCGDLRFERYLAETPPQVDVRAYVVNRCDELAASASGLNIPVIYESSGIVGDLIAGVVVRAALYVVVEYDRIALAIRAKSALAAKTQMMHV